jgi:hypothetical protein
VTPEQRRARKRDLYLANRDQVIGRSAARRATHKDDIQAEAPGP